MRSLMAAWNCQLNSATLISLLQDARSRSSNLLRRDRVRRCEEDTQGRPADHVALKMECILNRSMRRQKLLRGAL